MVSKKISDELDPDLWDSLEKTERIPMFSSGLDHLAGESPTVSSEKSPDNEFSNMGFESDAETQL